MEAKETPKQEAMESPAFEKMEKKKGIEKPASKKSSGRRSMGK